MAKAKKNHEPHCPECEDSLRKDLVVEELESAVEGLDECISTLDTCINTADETRAAVVAAEGEGEDTDPVALREGEAALHECALSVARKANGIIRYAIILDNLRVFSPKDAEAIGEFVGSFAGIATRTTDLDAENLRECVRSAKNAINLSIEHLSKSGGD